MAEIGYTKWFTFTPKGVELHERHVLWGNVPQLIRALCKVAADRGWWIKEIDDA